MALELNCTEDGRVQFHGLFEDLQMGPLLLWILEEEQQGELTITTEGQQQIIYFADGYPVGTRGGPAENFLGWILRETGHIDDGAYLTSLQKMAEEQQLQGQILLQMGVVTQDQLMTALVLQLRRKLIRLFRPIEGEFFFQSEEDLDIFDVEIGAINPYSLTANAVRQEFTRTRLDHCIHSLRSFGLRLDPDSQWRDKTQALGLENDEIAALSLLEPWNSVDHFLSQGYLDPTPAQVLLALLFSTNLLELDEDALALVAHQKAAATTSVPPPPQRTSAPPPPAATPSDDVSIRVETARRPGPAKDPNAPRKRASVTVHMKEDKIETQSDLDAVSTAPTTSGWGGPVTAQPAATQTDDATDPSMQAVSTDPSMQAIPAAAPTHGAVIAGPPPGESRGAVIAGPPPGSHGGAIAGPPPMRPAGARPAPSSPPAQAVIAGPPPGEQRGAVIAGPPPGESRGAVIAGPPPGESRGAVIAGPPPGANKPAPSAPAKPAPSAAAKAAASGGSGGLSDEDKAHKAAVEKKKDSLDGADYYAILEVERKATNNDIRKAYYAQSRTYHPDRVAGTPLEYLKDDLDHIFSFLNEAYSTLSNKSSRDEYDEKLSDPEAAALEERAPKAAQAEVFFSKANVFLKKRDYANAEEQLQWAAKLLPDEGDFQVTLAWAIYNNPNRERLDKVKKALFHLENAFECGNADPEKMHFYWGRIYKEEGNLEGALKHFEALLKHKPQHVEAVREVRYLKMQIRHPDDAKKSTSKAAGKSKAADKGKDTNKKGLFGLFKK